MSKNTQIIINFDRVYLVCSLRRQLLLIGPFCFASSSRASSLLLPRGQLALLLPRLVSKSCLASSSCLCSRFNRIVSYVFRSNLISHYFLVLKKKKPRCLVSDYWCPVSSACVYGGMCSLDVANSCRNDLVVTCASRVCCFASPPL